MSFCDVSLGECEDPADEFNAEFRDAEQPLTCYECGAPIAAGARYEHISMRYGDEERENYICQPCAEIAAEFSDGGRWIGVMWDDFENNWIDGARISACLNRVHTVAAKAKLRAKWLQWKGLGSLVAGAE